MWSVGGGMSEGVQSSGDDGAASMAVSLTCFK